MSHYFVGREAELRKLEDVYNKKMASLVVIKGRRRIGKSSLVYHFAKDKQLLSFSGMPPVDGLTAKDQRNEFMRQLSEQTDFPKLQIDDWADIFSILAEVTQHKKLVIFFDEITWLAHGDTTFLAKLKNAWDLYFKQNANITLILCGSVSAWIEKNILSSTGYFGRVSQQMTLTPLPLDACNQLLGLIGFRKSPLEKFWILSLTGGIPWYIELVKAQYDANENIKQLCFESDGVLVHEHRHIFHDLFGKRGSSYEKITELLAGGAFEYKEIAEKIGYVSSGQLSEYLQDLIISGYISKHPSWSFKSGRISKVVQYRLCDSYLRFYYKYIKPKLFQIENHQYAYQHVNALPGISAMMGLQFEMLVLNNRKLIYQALDLKEEDIVISNAYYQRKTKSKSACQIDLLIQTKLHTIYVCEIKFSRHTIGMDVVSQLEEKIKALQIPKTMSCVPVLIHAGEISAELQESDYLYKVIDFTHYLKK